MKKILKLAVCALSAAMFLGTISACSDNGEKTETTATTAKKEDGETDADVSDDQKETVTNSASGEKVSLLIMSGADQPEQPDGPLVWQAISEKMAEDGLNIEIEVRSYAWGDYKEQVNRMAAAGEKLDIYLNFQGELQGDVARKQCIPLNDLIEQYGSDIKEKVPESLFQDVMVDGNIYGVPANYPFVGDGAIMIRGDLRKKYEIPEITTLEGFEQYLDAVTKNEGNIAGFSARGGAEIDYNAFEEDTHMYIGADLATFAVIDSSVVPYKVESYFTSKPGVTRMEWSRKAYESGWIPSDALTVSDPNTLLVSGKTAAIPNDMWTVTSIGPVIRENIEGAEIETINFYDYSKDLIRLRKVNNYASICATSDHKEEAMMFLNWIRADRSNYELLMYGIEGTHWVAVGDDEFDLPEGVDPSARTYNPAPWWFREMSYDRVQVNSEPGFLHIYDQVIESSFTTPDLVGFTFSSEPVKTEWSQLSSAYPEIWGPIAQGIEASDEAYQKALQELDGLGLQTILEEIQKQLDEWAEINSIY